MDNDVYFVAKEDSDFIKLIHLLDEELHKMYGELQKTFDEFNTTDELAEIVVIYEKEEPIACGAIKVFDKDTVEVKRVFVRNDYRNLGYARKTILALEAKALNLGFTVSLLETGTKQQRAIEIYKKLGYSIIENYPPYIGNIHSVCMRKELKRCFWAGSDSIYQNYHDNEWGIPLHNDRRLFEMLILEGAQAGLSWITILKRREGYRQVFDNFDWTINAAYTDEELNTKLLDPRIIRNRLKVFSVRGNAKAFQQVIDEFGSFDAYIWAFVKGEPIVNHWNAKESLPAGTQLSELISKELKKRGFKFIGSTIVYAYMQAIGMVNDHMTDCFCH